jgi:hypothetical protein
MHVRDVACDIDGVLNKFIIEALAKFGTPIAYNDYSPDWGWEMLRGIEARYGRKVSDAEFWGAVKRDWWADSELSDEANRRSIPIVSPASWSGFRPSCRSGFNASS